VAQAGGECSTVVLHRKNPAVREKPVFEGLLRCHKTMAEREGHSATFILSACFPGKISKSGGLEGYISDYKVDYISQYAIRSAGRCMVCGPDRLPPQDLRLHRR
jgi:hypothetical protein